MKNKAASSSNAESDLDIDNEYEHSEDNYNSRSDEEEFNEIYQPPESFINKKITTDSKVNSYIIIYSL